MIPRRGASLLPLLLTCAPLYAGQRVPPVASYAIEASLDREHVLSGKESVTFVNRTHVRAGELRFHLYLNAFRNERSTWLRETAGRNNRGPFPKVSEKRFGWVEVNRIATADGADLTGGMRYESPDDGNADDRTVLVVPLGSPVEPGETARFDIDFSAKLPRVVARTGWKDDFVMGAQWFPKLGVLTDAGWNCHQFHGPTEFFSDFGDYEVTLTLPGEMKGKIGATGELVEESEIAGGLVRARFVATDVHDFAFTACARYEVYRDVFSRKGFPNVALLLLLQPDHRAVRDRYFRAVKEGLAHYGEWFVPYPYTTLTIVDPPWGSGAGGMEYPTLFTAGARWLSPKDVLSPEGVTVHEFGHQIFYGLLASNEFEEAHLDEGFDSYATARTTHAAWGDPPLDHRFFGIPFVFRSVRVPLEADSDAYRSWQLSARSDPTTQVSFRALDSAATRMNAYSKTALLLASCERTLGTEVWGRVLKTYATRFAFRHPTTADFRGVLKEIAGEKADDLLKETWDSSGTVDYAVTQAATAKAQPPSGFFGDGPSLKYRSGGKPGPAWESVVVVRRMGEAVWPTDVELRFAGGHVVRRTWDGRARWVRYRITGPKLLSAEADPDRKDLLDVNFLNNGMSAEPRPRAANVWGVKLRFLAQNLLEFFCALAVVR